MTNPMTSSPIEIIFLTTIERALEDSIEKIVITNKKESAEIIFRKDKEEFVFSTINDPDIFKEIFSFLSQEQRDGYIELAKEGVPVKISISFIGKEGIEIDMLKSIAVDEQGDTFNK